MAEIPASPQVAKQPIRAEASNPYARLQSSPAPIFLAEVFKDLHKYRDDQVIQVPMTIDTFKKFNEWLNQ